MDNYRVVIYRRNLKKTKLALELVLLVLRIVWEFLRLF